MNKLCFALAVALYCSGITARAEDNDYFSRIIEPDDRPLIVSVSGQRILKITNFVQEGGETHGLAALTTTAGKASFVLAAAFVGTEREIQKDFIVAGPATLSVNPIESAKLFITYRIERD